MSISGLIGGALFTRRKIMQLGPQRIVGIGVSLVVAGAAATLLVHATLGLPVLGLSLPQVLVTLGGGMLIPASEAWALTSRARASFGARVSSGWPSPAARVSRKVWVLRSTPGPPMASAEAR
ncbi:hypothetical protein [Pseudomonas sp. TCU-HL1]|uniref:hypothetical protein n=1 Tax=Pseudomonas sp. TCU-HL1 TaxID=1856685 RepID=UPI00083DDC30|nr:hypothetical protein [Pseudomonas sp. TCU-HL1]